MADFLANLVNRSRHSAAVLHPRPVSRYEPVAPVSAPAGIDASTAVDAPAFRDHDRPAPDITENTRSTLVVPGPQAHRHARLEAASPDSQAPTADSMNLVQAAPPNTSQRDTPPAVGKPVLRAARRVSQLPDHPPDHAANTDQVTPVQPDPTRPAAPDRQPQPYSVLRPNTGPDMTPPVLHPAQNPLPESPWDARRAPVADTPPEPAVSISIGRVEVTAVPPPPAPKREQQRPKAVVMSLDDYLKRREKERRT